MTSDQRPMTNDQKNTPRLHPGEQLILQGQGSYKHNLRSGWKVAQSLLTNQRLIMYQRPAIRFEIPLDDIKGMVVEAIHYVLRKRDCLAISYNSSEGSRGGKIWFIVNDLEEWRKRLIARSAFLKVDLKAIEKISAQLDSDSQDILWFLWERRYSKIDQLAELVDAPSHMHVLLKIRETINPIAEKLTGCPVLIFERSKVNPETGKAVLFSWWLAGQPDEPARNEERLVDIFDEGPQIRVIMEVRGIETEDLRLDFDKDRVTVRSHKIGASLREKLDLPHEVSPEGYDMYIRNNFLEIRLNKVRSPMSDVQRPMTTE